MQDSFRIGGLAASETLAITTTATAFALPLGDGCQVRLVNESTGVIGFNFGTSATVPSNTTYCALEPGATETFTIDYQILSNAPGYIYAIAASAGNLNVTRGSGM
jgi:hypothetical protein